MLEKLNAQVHAMAAWILDNYPQEFGVGNPIQEESAVVIGLRLLERMERVIEKTRDLATDRPTDALWGSVLEALNALEHPDLGVYGVDD